MKKPINFTIFPEKLTSFLAYSLLIMVVLVAIAVFYMQWEYDDVTISSNLVHASTPSQDNRMIINERRSWGVNHYKDLKYGFSFNYIGVHNIKAVNEDNSVIEIVDNDRDSNKMVVVKELSDEYMDMNLPKYPVIGELSGQVCDQEIIVGENSGYNCLNKVDPPTLELAFIHGNYQYHLLFNGISTIEGADQLLLNSFQMFDPKE